MELQTTWYIVAVALIVVGLLGTVLPVLPGLPVMFAGMWLAAWADGYQRIGAGVLVVLGILVAVSIATDFLASLLGARRAGASGKGLWGAGIGGFVGIFFGLPGLLAGPLLGAAAGEMAHGRSWRDASRIGAGTWIGLLVGAIFKVLLALAMLVLFVAALVLD